MEYIVYLWTKPYIHIHIGYVYVYICGKIFHIWHRIDPQNVLDFATFRF